MILPVRIEMLGGLVALVGARKIERFQTQKTGLLLAYLALQAQRVVNREAIAELLWPDADFVSKRNRLNQAVSSLRRQLLTPEDPNPSIILAEGQMIGLNWPGVVTDVGEFERLIEAALKSKTPQERYRATRSAVDLYKGDLLEGYYPDWGLTDRLRLADRYAWALNELVRHHSRAGEPELAAEFVQRRLASDPRDMEAHAQLMELYLRAARPSTALRHFEEISTAFTASDPIPPEIERLYKRALKENSRSTSTLPRANHPSKPEISVVGESTRSTLPRPWDAFFGREQEIKALSSSLESGERLITILGIGGSGKTRLALEVAWKVAERYGGRAYVVGLSHTMDTEAIPGECLKRMFGSDMPAGNGSFSSLAAALNSRGRALLILDNMEQLIPACTEFLTTLLDQVPEVQVLCTSRQPVDIGFERQLLLQPLPTPTRTESSLSEIARSPAIGLFLSRAQAVRSDFQLTERTASVVVDLCSELEGLPLAIELAAGWSRTLSPSQILEWVSSRSQFLESRRKDVSPRHRSMMAAIEGSYDLLGVAEREVFLRLSGFSGGWTHLAAVRLCPGFDMVSILDSLVSKSMVTPDAQDRDTVRFSMLETLRVFARQQISSELSEEVGRLHADYFIEYAMEAAAGRNLVASLDCEYFNIVCALQFLVEHEELRAASRLSGFMVEFWELRGLPTEGVKWIEACLKSPFEPATLLDAQLLASSGRLLWLKGEYEEAAKRLEAALPLLQAEGSGWDLMQAHLLLAREAHRRGDFDAALSWLSKNLGIEFKDSLTLEARSRLGMGNAYVEIGHWSEAQREYERALDLFNKTGDKYWTGSIMVNLGNLAYLQNHLDIAREWSDRALELHSQSGHGWHTAMDLVLRAKLDSAAGQLRSALEGLEKAYRMSPEVVAVQWRVLHEAAWVFSRLGRVDAAIKTYGFVERLLEENSPGRHPVEAKTVEERIAELRQTIPKERFDSYWSLGRSLHRTEIVKLLATF